MTTLNDTQQGLIETCMISAIEKWEAMVKEAQEHGEGELGIVQTMQKQVDDARELLYVIQDAEEVVVA